MSSSLKTGMSSDHKETSPILNTTPLSIHVFVVMVAALSALFMVKRGIALSEDGMNYLIGMQCAFLLDPCFGNHWPPLYSMLLRAVQGITHLSLYNTVALTQCGLWFASIIAWFRLLEKSFPSRHLMHAWLVLAFATSGEIFDMYVNVQSEPLFMFLMMMLLHSMYHASTTQEPSLWPWARTGFLAAALMLTRWLGGAFVVGGLVATALFSQGMKTQQRLKIVATYAFASGIPIILWMIRNKIVKGELQYLSTTWAAGEPDFPLDVILTSILRAFSRITFGLPARFAEQPILASLFLLCIFLSISWVIVQSKRQPLSANATLLYVGIVIYVGGFACLNIWSKGLFRTNLYYKMLIPFGIYLLAQVYMYSSQFHGRLLTLLRTFSIAVLLMLTAQGGVVLIRNTQELIAKDMIGREGALRAWHAHLLTPTNRFDSFWRMEQWMNDAPDKTYILSGELGPSMAFITNKEIKHKPLTLDFTKKLISGDIQATSGNNEIGLLLLEPKRLDSPSMRQLFAYSKQHFKPVLEDMDSDLFIYAY